MNLKLQIELALLKTEAPGHYVSQQRTAREFNIDFYIVRKIGLDLDHLTTNARIARIARKLNSPKLSETNKIPEGYRAALIGKDTFIIPNVNVSKIDCYIEPRKSPTEKLIAKRTRPAADILWSTFPKLKPRRAEITIIILERGMSEYVEIIKLPKRNQAKYTICMPASWFHLPFYGTTDWLIKQITQTTEEDGTTCYETQAWSRAKLLSNNACPAETRWFAINKNLIGVGGTRNIAQRALKTRTKNQVSKTLWEDE